MPTFSSCPRCQKPVSLPAGVDSAALVRCPLCAAEYRLSEAIPPELIPVLVATDQASAAGRTVEHEEVTIEHEENEAAAVAVGQSRMAAMAAVRGRQPGPASALKRLIEVVTGGLAGCLVAYYGLALWFGPEFKAFGFPELPGVAWLTAAPVKGNAAGEKPSLEKSVPAKPANGATSPEPPEAGKTSGNTATTPKAGSQPPPSGTSAKPAG